MNESGQPLAAPNRGVNVGVGEDGFTFSPSETNLDYIIRRLREVAKETPEEYQRRWPYNHKVELNAADCRDLLEVLDARP